MRVLLGALVLAALAFASGEALPHLLSRWLKELHPIDDKGAAKYLERFGYVSDHKSLLSEATHAVGGFLFKSKHEIKDAVK